MAGLRANTKKELIGLIDELQAERSRAGGGPAESGFRKFPGGRAAWQKKGRNKSKTLLKRLPENQTSARTLVQAGCGRRLCHGLGR